MKNIFLALITLIASTSYAAEIKGLRCQTNYVVHEKDKSNGIDRVWMKTSISGLRPVLDGSSIIPVNNAVKNFGESYSGSDADFRIDYRITVGTESSNLIIDVTSAGELLPLADIDFVTHEGITVSQNLLGMTKIGIGAKNFTDYTDVIVSCHPAY